MSKKLLFLGGVSLILSACDSTKNQEGYTDMASNSTCDMVAPTPGTHEDFRLNVGDRIFFGFDKYDITPEGMKLIEAQAGWLKTYDSVSVAVEGHTDARGTQDYNMALGLRRAEAVRKALIAHGVCHDRIKVVSYGKDKLESTETTKEGHDQNRRAVIVVSCK